MVHFVGAGPGAADLITLRGQRLLSEAGTVIYAGSLVNPELLSFCKKGARLFDSAYMTLEEVIAQVRSAEAGKRDTVRLHTGDPSLYGAIREQMEALDREGIAYDVTPGVASFLGAAASLKAELTLPGVSQTVILTRVAGRTPVPEGEDLRELARHGCSLVLFLSAGRLPEVQEALLSGAYRADTPAAIVYRATWPTERVIRTTVGDLARAGQEAGITRTALIFVGDFLTAAGERSCLYDPRFTTLFREGEA